ncbi:765_t:CDS:2, partial [Ambispora gerdemannii]
TVEKSTKRLDKNMLPPPSAVYSSADELFQSVQKFANSQGYALVKKRTRKDRYVFAHNNLLYVNIRDKVSTFALKKVNEQYQKANRATTQEPLLSCTRSFSSTMGLPCAHDIQRLGNRQSLMLDDIHEHWWIQERSPIPQYEENVLHEDVLQPLLQNLQERYKEWPEYQQVTTRVTLNNMINTPLLILQNPQIVHTRGRPVGTSNHRQTNSTKRDSSGFELVDRRIRQCTLCKQPGHNIRTCPNRS